ncbi:MAG: hypothetical protein NDF53_01705 [archaeon GB-1867-097]|nr:hypothetical protein [Candidatus Culexmicrobium thermophilum]RLE56427.1 MAG: hypothetical protein DRJ30_02125 [Candidatus Verstraetearchaeota archaeon]HDO20184.1 hypothetical protein [Candidatus Bathyarchaeota archaeon]
MVLSAKIYEVREKQPIRSLARKLFNYRVEEEEEGRRLITEITDLEVAGRRLRGVYSKDMIIFINRRGEKTPTLITRESPFTFTEYDDRLLLTIIGKKNWANYVANELSKILFITIGNIVEVKIKAETLRRYHEENPEGTKVIFFDNVDIPNVDKLSLYGPDLMNTTLYNQYLSHGNIWYIVATSRKFGYIIGITRNCVITAFSKISEYDFMRFIEEEIYPLIS